MNFEEQQIINRSVEVYDGVWWYDQAWWNKKLLKLNWMKYEKPIKIPNIEFSVFRIETNDRKEFTKIRIDTETVCTKHIARFIGACTKNWNCRLNKDCNQHIVFYKYLTSFIFLEEIKTWSKNSLCLCGKIKFDELWQR